MPDSVLHVITEGVVSATSSPSMAVNITTPTAGHLLVVCQANDTELAYSTVEDDNGNEFNKLYACKADPYVAGQANGAIWFKFADGTETSVTCNFIANNKGELCCSQYSGIDPDDPFLGFAENLSGIPVATTEQSAGAGFSEIDAGLAFFVLFVGSTNKWDSTDGVAVTHGTIRNDLTRSGVGGGLVLADDSYKTIGHKETEFSTNSDGAGGAGGAVLLFRPVGVYKSDLETTGVVIPSRLLPNQGRYPGVKPVGNVEIDWNHPLARGLSHFILFQDGNPYDLVTGVKLTKGGGTRWEPEGQYFDEIDDYLTLAGVELNSGFTFITHPTFIDNSGVQHQYFLSFGTAAGANSFNWMLYESGNAEGDVLGVIGNSAVAGNINKTLVDYWSVYNGEPISTTVNGSVVKQYISREDQSGVQSFGTSDMPDGTTKTLYIGGRTGLASDKFMGGWLKYVMIYGDRVLPQIEIAAIHRDPYQFLRTIN